jgi:hypothetical protein
MKGKKKYYKLDEIGFVGTQEKVSSFKKRNTAKKTGEVFEAARKAATGHKQRKAS